MWQLIGQIAELIQTMMGSKGVVLIAAIGIPLWCAGIIGLFFGRKVHDTAAVIVGIVTGVLFAVQPLGALQEVAVARLVGTLVAMAEHNGPMSVAERVGDPARPFGGGAADQHGVASLASDGQRLGLLVDLVDQAVQLRASRRHTHSSHSQHLHPQRT